ncbi:unnamed protein product [Rhizophagus irregularis]|nr:unnamed protein product [Rhizophagus irregularis]
MTLVQIRRATLPRVVLSAHFSPRRAPSPSEFSSSPISYSSADEDIDAITTLASLAVEERKKIHLSPAFSSVASSAVSSPPSSPCPQSPRRKHKSVITEDDEREEYYRERAAPIPSLEAPYTKTRRIPIPTIGGDGVIGCGGYKFIPPNNPNFPNYPIHQKRAKFF